MPRTVAELPPGARITDYISLGVITKTFPLSSIGPVLSSTGKSSVRQRDLPAQVVVSYVIALALYMQSSYPSERDWRHKTNGIVLRVIDYRLEGIEGSEPIYRLATTILDAAKAPAGELAALYDERGEIETAFDELKTHLRGARIVLRSKTPDLVRQEFYGLLMAHFAIRGLMHEAALKADEDPDRLSFLHAVRVIRRKMAVYGAIPPCEEEGLS